MADAGVIEEHQVKHPTLHRSPGGRVAPPRPPLGARVIQARHSNALPCCSDQASARPPCRPPLGARVIQARRSNALPCCSDQASARPPCRPSCEVFNTGQRSSPPATPPFIPKILRNLS